MTARCHDGGQTETAAHRSGPSTKRTPNSVVHSHVVRKSLLSDRGTRNDQVGNATEPPLTINETTDCRGHFDEQPVIRADFNESQ